MYKVGDKIETWFSNSQDRCSTILEILPYNGKYKEYFKYMLKVTAPRTLKGYLYFPV